MQRNLPILRRASLPAQARAHEFAPAILSLQREPPSPLPRFVPWTVLVLAALLLAWSALGSLDIVAVAEGRLVPQSQLKIVQPAEGGVVRDLLVKEGDRVEAGQVLARMDAQIAEADARALETEFKLKALKLRRIAAELEGRRLAQHADDPPQLYRQVEAQYLARRAAHENSLAEERAVVARARQEMKSAEEARAKLSQTLPLLREQEQAFERLARDGFAGRLMVQQRTRERIELEQDLRSQESRVEAQKHSIQQAERRMAQITANYLSQLHGENVEAQGQYDRLAQEWQKLLHRRGLLELRAPASGTIKDLATHTAGAVVAPGTVLMTLVPTGEPLRAEVWLANEDAGFVRAGLKTTLKLAGFPFQRYGTLEGRVDQVSADAIERTDPARGTMPSPAGLAYRALVALPGDALHAPDGSRHALLPGMKVFAEIHTGERSVLEYLLSPVQKVVQEAGRER